MRYSRLNCFYVSYSICYVSIRQRLTIYVNCMFKESCKLGFFTFRIDSSLLKYALIDITKIFNIKNGRTKNLQASFFCQFSPASIEDKRIFLLLYIDHQEWYKCGTRKGESSKKHKKMRFICSIRSQLCQTANLKIILLYLTLFWYTFLENIICLNI